MGARIATASNDSTGQGAIIAGLQTVGATFSAILPTTASRNVGDASATVAVAHNAVICTRPYASSAWLPAARNRRSARRRTRNRVTLCNWRWSAPSAQVTAVMVGHLAAGLTVCITPELPVRRG